MKNILSVLYVFVMLIKHQEKNIQFIVVSPIPHNPLEETSTQNGPPKKNNKIIVKIIK